MKAKNLDFNLLNRITDRAYYVALSMIDIANNRKVKERGEPKVGGHPSACASSKHILAAIHLVMREAPDYFACKPHVSPMDHAFNYLLHLFRTKSGEWMNNNDCKLAMHHLRHYSSKSEPVFQSYHAEADPDSFRYFPSGSVGIPPVNALYSALAYAYAKDHGFPLDETPYFWCLMGDSEFREGSLAEAMPDAGERELSRLLWIVDYNRQNLDGTRVSNEKALGGSDGDRIVRIAEANGWHAVKLKHGKKREKTFSQPGGAEFKRVLDEMLTDFEFQALLSANDPKLTRKTLEEKSNSLKKFFNKHSDSEIQELFLNLGGHDLESLVEVFQTAVSSQSKPTLLVAYTIKGHGLECQALSGNHSTMPEEEELKRMAKKLGVSRENPFEAFPDNSPEARYLKGRSEFLRRGIGDIEKQIEGRRKNRVSVNWPSEFGITALKFNPIAHTQWMWGQIAAKLDRLARGDSESNAKLSTDEKEWQKIAPYFLTMAPDVGSSTNTSPNMNGKLYGMTEQEDFEKLYGAKDEKAPDVVPHPDKKTGHIRFEIAEGNCMSAAGSFGKMGHFTGIPFYPAMTIYDFFVKRAHDQFYYNLYWHSHFATIGTPSGVTLSSEGAQHSWKSDFQIPNCVTWEPVFAKELEWILADTLRRHFTEEDSDREGSLIRCVTKGLVQKEFLDRLKRQVRFKAQPTAPITPDTSDSNASISENEIQEIIRKDVLNGGYALIDYSQYEDYVPGDNVAHLFSMGALVPEAVKASDALLKSGIYANVFVVTSPDLLLGNFAYKENFKHLKEILNPARNVPVVSVHDGEPGILDNIGSVLGVKQKTLAIRKTSKSGTTWDIFHYHGIDAEGIVRAVTEVMQEVEERVLDDSGPLSIAEIS